MLPGYVCRSLVNYSAKEWIESKGGSREIWLLLNYPFSFFFSDPHNSDNPLHVTLEDTEEKCNHFELHFRSNVLSCNTNSELT